MLLKMETPAAGGTANGGNAKAANLLPDDYRDGDSFATGFEHIGTVAMRVVHLARRHGLPLHTAALVAPLAYGEARQ